MAQKRLGVVVSAPDSSAVLTSIAELEQRGIPAAWLTSAGAGGADPLGAFVGAALRTQHILLGTAITQTFPRHPIAVAQQALVLAQLAPGRFRLGLGTSGRAGMEQTYGVNFHAPLGHLREYLRIVKALLQQGSVDFTGRYYQAHTRLASPVDVPVMAAALGPKAYELCGAEADGAISWVCPGAYLRDVALPALRRGAESASRPVPPLLAHAPVCVHDDAEEVRTAVRQQFGFFARAPFYQNMFRAAGFEEVSQGTWSDAMIDAVVLWGDEARVTEGIAGLFALGAAEILVSPVAAGGDRAASLERTLRLLSQVAQAGR
ncbi:MAG TPA: LLM class flavin-dependent oxidoreductase [Alphaproteobacteria bacterium]|nr:LLM class flavin-dependent oxidoreductase [Alphaproteobacteria bacterium]